jgi:hypothetical protein
LLILGIALLIFSLMERAVRQALATGEKMAGRLAGHGAARPTGDNLLNALSEITLARVQVAGEWHRAASTLRPLHHRLLQSLGVPGTVYTDLAA